MMRCPFCDKAVFQRQNDIPMDLIFFDASGARFRPDMKREACCACSVVLFGMEELATCAC